ncbi:MAG: extracellular solute-binding protein [Anaerolineaceae bacterium]|nr:extracellular solute-binding protein [Anaerolineaceae bacterium]
MKHLYRVMAAILVLVFVLAACAPAATMAPAATEMPAVTEAVAATAAPAAEKVTIRFAYNWTGGDSKAAYYEAAIKTYQEKHPNVEIILEGTPGMEHQNKILTDLAGGNLPDLFMYWNGASTLQPLLDGNAILDMDEFFKVSKATKRDQWNESTFSTSIVNGVTYELPVESFKGFMIANKALFDKYNLKYPTTMAEWKEVAKVFVENGIVPILMASKGGNPGHLFYNDLVYQMGGLEGFQELDKTYKLTPPFLKAAELVNEMSAAKFFPSDTIANGDWGPAVALYNEEKAAMVYCFPWKIGDIKPELLAQTVVINFPKMEGAVVDPSTFSIGGVSMGLVINKASFEDSAKQAEIVEFADFLVSDAMFTELGKASMMPAKKVTLDPSSLNPLFVAAVDFSSKMETYDVLWSKFSGAASQTVYSDFNDELFAGAPAAEVIAKLQKALDQDKPK